MRQLLRYFFVFLACLAASARAATAGFDPEAEKIAQSIEQSILRNVQGFLGADIPIMIHVEMLPVDAPVSAEDDDGKNKGDTLDLGYVEAMPPVKKDRSQAEEDVPKYGGVRVYVGLPSKLSDDQIEAVKNLVRTSAKSLSPKIRIVPLDKVETPKPKPSTDAERNPASETGPSAFERLLQKYGALLPLLGALVVGAGLVFGAWMLLAAFKQIARGIQDFRFPNMGGNPDKPFVLEHKNGADAAMPERPRTPPPPTDRSRAYLRNLKTLRTELARNPMSLLRCLSETEEDLNGIRWLLPQLSESEQEATKSLLGADRMQKIGALSKDSAENWDSFGWLENLVQTLTFKRLSIRSALESALPSEDLVRLAKMPAEQLQAVVPADDVLALRIVLEVLPAERGLELLRKATDKVWEGLIQQAWPAAEELKATATRLLAAAATPTDAATPAQNSGRAEFFSQILLEPTLALLSEKAPGDDDVFLESLARKDRGFAELVRSRFWTAGTLSRISDEVLRAPIAALPPKAKAALLVALPDAVSERFTGLLPAGMGKTIAVDQSRKIRERNDAQEIAACRAELRAFLNELQAAADRGEFELTKETAVEAVPEATPTEESREAA